MSDEQHDAAMREIAIDALRVAGRYRRLWERGTEWQRGAPYRLDAGQAQVLLAHAVAPRILTEQLAERLGIKESSVRRVRGELRALSLLEDIGRHPDSYRQRLNALTTKGELEYQAVVTRLGHAFADEKHWPGDDAFRIGA